MYLQVRLMIILGSYNSLQDKSRIVWVFHSQFFSTVTLGFISIYFGSEVHSHVQSLNQLHADLSQARSALIEEAEDSDCGSP